MSRRARSLALSLHATLRDLHASNACVVRVNGQPVLRGTPTPDVVTRCKALRDDVVRWLDAVYPPHHSFYREDPSHTIAVQRAALMFSGRVVGWF